MVCSAQKILSGPNLHFPPPIFVSGLVSGPVVNVFDSGLVSGPGHVVKNIYIFVSGLVSGPGHLVKKSFCFWPSEWA